MSGAERFQRIRRGVLFVIGAYLTLSGLWLLVAASDAGSAGSGLGWVLGLGGAALIFAAAVWLGPRAVNAASDELYRELSRRAWAFGYWWGVCLYPPVVALLILDLVEIRQAFVALGTLFAGVPLLYFVWLDWRAGA